MTDSKTTVAGPLVTVGVALYNHEKYIAQCLESILDQNYKNIELIVIDDGSPDQSHAAAEACLKARNCQDRVKLISRPNKGMCNTLNEIAQQSNGKYISFIGSDDFWLPHKISDQLAYLEAHEEHALVHSNSTRVDSSGAFIKEMDYSTRDHEGELFEAMIRKTGGINTPSHLYRSSVFEQIGYYDPQFKFEDTDFWLRLTKRFTVGFINQTHTCYRWHGNNLSARGNNLSFYFDDLIAIYTKNIDDVALRKYAVSRLCRKGIARSLKQLDFASAKKFTRLLFAQ